MLNSSLSMVGPALLTSRGVVVAKDRTLSDLLLAENKSGINDFITYAGFAENCITQKERLRRMVSTIADSGKIQALGAPVKGSTIINFCGLDEKQ